MSGGIVESGETPMRLVEPTDFLILGAFEKTGRNTAPNIAIHIDKNKDYINTRLPQLANDGYLEKIGPAENSGLYEITEKGRLAVEHWDIHTTDRDRFHEIVDAAE
jgi:predicted transcriptional regulator